MVARVAMRLPCARCITTCPLISQGNPIRAFDLRSPACIVAASQPAALPRAPVFQRREVPVANIQSDKADPPAKDTAGSRLSAKRAAKAAQKASQRGTSNPVEDVAKSVRVVNAWIDDHGHKVWYGLGGVAVAIAVGIGVSLYVNSRNRDAGDILRGAISTSAGVIVPP